MQLPNHFTFQRLPSRLLAAAMTSFSLVALAFGCSDSKPAIDARDDEGHQMCCVLGDLCHVAEQSTAGAGGAAGAGGGGGGSLAPKPPQSVQDCHRLGHEGDPDRCREYYDHCLDLCEADAEATQAAAELDCH